MADNQKVAGIYGEFDIRGLRDSIRQLKKIRSEYDRLHTKLQGLKSKESAHTREIKRKITAVKKLNSEQQRNNKLTRAQMWFDKKIRSIGASSQERASLHSQMAAAARGYQAGKLAGPQLDARMLKIKERMQLIEERTSKENISQKIATRQKAQQEREILKLKRQQLAEDRKLQNKQATTLRQRAASMRVGRERFSGVASTGNYTPADLAKYRSRLAELNNQLRTGAISSQVYNVRLTQLLVTMRRGSAVTQSFSQQLKGMRGIMIGLTASWTAFAAGASLLQTGREFQNIGIMMKAAMGEDAVEGMRYARAEAKRLGLDIAQTAEGFSKFYAAVSPLEIDRGEIEDMFSSFSEASVVYGLDPDRYKMMMLALQQIASKGVVSMEELRRQLAEHLPGVMDTAAKGMDMSTAEFIKAVEAGNVLSKDFLPAFAKALREKTSGAMEEGMARVQVSQSQMMNDWNLLKKAIFDAGFDEIFINIFNLVGNTLTAMKPMIVLFVSALSTIFETLSWPIRILMAALADLSDWAEASGFLEAMEGLGALIGHIASFFMGGVVVKALKLILGLVTKISQIITPLLNPLFKLLSQFSNTSGAAGQAMRAVEGSGNLMRKAATEGIFDAAIRRANIVASVATASGTVRNQVDLRVDLSPEAQRNLRVNPVRNMMFDIDSSARR